MAAKPFKSESQVQVLGVRHSGARSFMGEDAGRLSTGCGQRRMAPVSGTGISCACKQHHPDHAFSFDPLHNWLLHLTLDQGIGGSNPSGSAKLSWLAQQTAMIDYSPPNRGEPENEPRFFFKPA